MRSELYDSFSHAAGRVASYLASYWLHAALSVSFGFVGGSFGAQLLGAFDRLPPSLAFLADTSVLNLVSLVILSALFAHILCRHLDANSVLHRWANNLQCAQPLFCRWDIEAFASLGLIIGARDAIRLDYCVAILPPGVAVIIGCWHLLSGAKDPAAATAPRHTSRFLPITHPDEDKLGRASVVDAVERAVRHVWEDPSHRGGIVGLRGEHGSGKTSILNLLQRRLQTDADAVILAIVDGWPIRGATAMQRHLLHEIDAGVARHYNSEEFRDALRSYIEIVEEGWPAAKGSRLLTALSGVRSATLEQRCEVLRELLGRINHRLLVIIDDLDRLLPDELYSLMRTLDHLRQLPRTAFLLSYDPQITPAKFELAARGRGAPR